MAAGRWPWPGRSGTRSARCWPWPTSASTPFTRPLRRGGTAGPAGQADHGRDPRLARPDVQLCADRGADRCRGPGRSRARRRGGPGPGPGRGRPVEPGGPAAQDRGPGPAGGPHRDAAAHLREGLQVAVRAGSWFELLTGLSQCGDLCAATGRSAEALTLWAAASRASTGSGGICRPAVVRARREEQLRPARQALGPGRARAAEDRGTAMSLPTAAEYALMLTDPGPPQSAAPGSGSSAPGNGSWSPWSPRAAPTPRSPPSCTSASAPSARTWTGSGTRPAAAAAPT